MVAVEMKTVGNGRENPLTVSATVFFVGNGNGNGKIGRENEIGITGYREPNQSVGTYRLRSGIDNSKRENTYNHFKHLTR